MFILAIFLQTPWDQFSQMNATRTIFVLFDETFDFCPLPRDEPDRCRCPDSRLSTPLLSVVVPDTIARGQRGMGRLYSEFCISCTDDLMVCITLTFTTPTGALNSPHSYLSNKSAITAAPPKSLSAHCRGREGGGGEGQGAERGCGGWGCVCRQEIEGYLGVIDEARGALETEAERAAGLQKQVAELTTALEEKDLEVRR